MKKVALIIGSVIFLSLPTVVVLADPSLLSDEKKAEATPTSDSSSSIAANSSSSISASSDSSASSLPARSSQAKAGASSESIIEMPYAFPEEKINDVITTSSSSSFSSALESSSSESASSKASPVEEISLSNAETGSKSIMIFLKTQMAYLLQNGHVIKTYRISSGKADTPTPTGVFKIYEKDSLRVSHLAVPYRMPNYMAFTPNGAFGLHGLPYLGGAPETSAYWHEAVSHIGIPVSHGCIRFLPEEAAEIYNWVEVGTPVVIQA